MDRTEKVILCVFVGVLMFGIFAVLAWLGFMYLGEKASAQPIATQTWSAPVSSTPTIGEECQVESAQILPGNHDLDGALATLDTLEHTQIPATDLVTVAEQFKGKKNLPRSLTTPAVRYQVGDSLGFWVLHTTTNDYSRVKAHLLYASEDVYFWVADGVTYDPDELKTFMNTFDRKIYPTDQAFFGKEWIPGVDNDPHLFVLYAPGLGDSVAGYTSGTDEVLTAAHPYANEHEMFVINSDIQSLSDPYTYAVAAHELQHLIHNYHDSNEEGWLNEGFSELAVLLNGYETGGFDTVFSYNPDLQLNNWPNDPNLTEAHYGASFLFTTYLLDRFGNSVTQAVVADPLNGLDSLDDVFNARNVVDPLSGKVETADQLFQDWSLANYLQNPSLADGRFGYHNYTALPHFSDTEVIANCSPEAQKRSVHQYGTDYIMLECSGNYQLNFSGSPEVEVIPPASKDGQFYLWSNKADASDTSMTRLFDFTKTTGTINLSFDTWYDLEKGYDYVYVLASENGQDWKMLQTPSCSTKNDTGNNYGCGYTGTSSTWSHETVDLSVYAGKKIWLRLEYITDAAVTGEGFAIDNLSIPTIGYSAGFESDEDGWELNGFVRMNNHLPQTFLVSTIQKSAGKMLVQEYQVGAGEELSLNINTDCSTPDLVLVVSGSSRYSRQLADYQFQIMQK